MSTGLRALASSGLITLLLFVASACHRAPAAPRIDKSFPNAPVIIISIDTLRADHLPAWGYDGVKTPNIDGLVRDGVTFRNAYSHVPLTLPSHVTLFTGKLPADNGVRDNIGYRFTSDGATLPQLLNKHGYQTGAAVSAYVLRGETGLRSIFDWYDDRFDFQAGAAAGEIQRNGSATAAAGESWIASNDQKPFLFFLHLYEPHAPYTPPEPFRSASRTPYDGEVGYADAIVGEFLEQLKKRGDYDRSIIVLLSDHGEGLGDHGEREHGVFLYREALHVPLIVKLPKGTAAGTSIDAPVGLIDLFPTLLRLTGVAAPAGLRGENLFDAHRPRTIFSESQYARLHFGWSALRSLIGDEHHYIDAPRAELFAFRSDPRESNNIATEDRRSLAALREEMQRYPVEVAAPADVSAEERAKLTALGYVSSKATAVEGELPDPKDRLADLTLYEDATAAIARGELESGVSGLQQVVQRNPNFTDAALGLADALEKSGRSADAVAIYREVMKKNPAMVEQVAIGIATAYMNLRQFDQARAHAALAKATNPGGASLLLARIALAAGDPARAEAEGRAAMRDPHYVVPGTFVTADALLAQGRAEAALKLLGDVKNARGAGVARADALVRLQRPADAVTALREEIRLFPDERDAYGKLAALLLLQRDERGANEVFEQMAAAMPGRTAADLAARTFEHFGYAASAQRWRARASQP